MVALYGVFTGLITYLIITFLFQPIMRYKDLKSQIISDLAFYANAVELSKDNKIGSYRKKVKERTLANRRHACDLEAAVQYLPKFYLDYLHAHDEFPGRASELMFGLSNTYDLKGYERIKEVRLLLRLNRYESR